MTDEPTKPAAIAAIAAIIDGGPDRFAELVAEFQRLAGSNQ